jgi:hypothetical protein
VVCLRKDQAVGIREEYHAFRSRAVPVMFAIPLALFIGMRRADAVAAGAAGQGQLTLTPPLMTGARRAARQPGEAGWGGAVGGGAAPPPGGGGGGGAVARPPAAP